VKRAVIEPGPVGKCSVCKASSGHLRPATSGELECCLGKCWSRDFGHVQQQTTVRVVLGLVAEQSPSVVALIVLKATPAPMPFRFGPSDVARGDEPFLEAAGFHVDGLTGHPTRGQCHPCGGQGCQACKGTGEDREPTAAELTFWRESGGNA
jgi:hypothetical protein